MMTISGQCQNGSTVHSNNTEIPHSPTKVCSLEPISGVTKKLLPLAAFFMAFTTVMTVLIIYMENTGKKLDLTSSILLLIRVLLVHSVYRILFPHIRYVDCLEFIAMRHYQFRVNMSQDYELLGVSQDNPQLVTYIREVHLAPAIEPHHKPLESENSVSKDTAYVLKLLKNKRDGTFVEAGAYSDGKTSKTEWLEEKLNWRGLLIQPDPRHYFSLRRHNRVRSQAVHACLSPMPYPKEVTLHQESDGVKINSVHANSIEDPDWFNTRVKCFPLLSLLLAMNITNIDYFSLETGGTELQVLETIPFQRVKIEIIGVHLVASDFEKDTIKKFLATKKYSFMESFNSSYIFMMNHIKI